MPVFIWMAMDIQESSPASAKTVSFGCRLSSRTGRVVPTIFGSMDLSLMSVVRVDDAMATRCVRRWIPRAIVADSDDQHLSAHGLETVSFLEVVLELADELLLDVHDAAADLADRVMMVAARELVVRRPLTEVGGVHRP